MKIKLPTEIIAQAMTGIEVHENDVILTRTHPHMREGMIGMRIVDAKVELDFVGFKVEMTDHEAESMGLTLIRATI